MDLEELQYKKINSAVSVQITIRKKRDLMNYSYYDLGYLKKGQVVEVKLTAAANVRLMDSMNYGNYKAGRKHHYGKEPSVHRMS